MSNAVVQIIALVATGATVVLAAVVGAVLLVCILRRRGQPDPFETLGIACMGVGWTRRYCAEVEGRSIVAELDPRTGLLMRAPCRGRANLSIGAKVALAGLAGTMPPDREALDLQDADFAGLSIWTDDHGWAEELLDAPSRRTVLALLRPGAEVRSIYFTPNEVCVRALSICEERITPERMARWIADVHALALRAEDVTRGEVSESTASPAGGIVIPRTLVLI